MEIILQEEHDKKIIKLNGEIDMSNVDDVKNRINSFELKEIILDFTNVKYIDSSGIGMLIGIHKNSLLKGGSLTIKNVDNKILKLLDMVGLTKILNIMQEG
ncbi:STAS domain-containing protein [Oceanotoga sp. DSM 15011]|uniref:Anti-sigma factor antagonist n=1 Tax=Oceanotoga teriensis TaxID=515440 RepID=A0AA45C8K5_9BACT|nr:MULTISPECIES: STAS domain-containing protein [Oceanotoga]MDN5342412.1 hypothetical protein [Oceanotoga sp.]MDO7975507.1 STAS domain-containing protein [Oceanotoga teriensis]PWJ96205.1 SpoIIAA-like anti-anti-sigma regulatory factor [Oceanotoga teriensis]UYO99988.1 STAS domain-containing protein [Oceanotoga sp. DSM 15011]